MECPNCQSVLKIVKFVDFKTTKQHIDKKLYNFTVPEIEFPHCEQCNITFATNLSEQRIKKAFKKFLQDNKITVYADDLISAYLADVPETDSKFVRDVLCDMVFFNFGNLSYQQLRPLVQNIVSESVDIDPNMPYIDKYKEFMSSFMNEDKIALAKLQRKELHEDQLC